MNWQEIKVITLQEAVEGVSDLLYDLGSGGVIIEDPELINSLANAGEWDAYELPDEVLKASHPWVKGYLPVDERLPKRIEALKLGLDEISNRLDKCLMKIEFSQVQEEDWANNWKAYFKPHKIGNRVVIKPSWEEYTPINDEVIVELDPGMAFGTGNHATTSMCIEVIEKNIVQDCTVLDVGTGSGILSIAAAKLGAKKILAMDYDLVAVKVAQENINLNKVEHKIQVFQNDLLSGITEKAHLIVANIIADIIIRLAPQIKERMLPGGRFLASGIISERAQEVIDAAIYYGLLPLEKKEQDDWVAIVFKAKED